MPFPIASKVESKVTNANDEAALPPALRLKKTARVSLAPSAKTVTRFIRNVAAPLTRRRSNETPTAAPRDDVARSCTPDKSISCGASNSGDGDDAVNRIAYALADVGDHAAKRLSETMTEALDHAVSAASHTTPDVELERDERVMLTRDAPCSVLDCTKKAGADGKPLAEMTVCVRVKNELRKELVNTASPPARKLAKLILDRRTATERSEKAPTRLDDAPNVVTDDTNDAPVKAKLFKTVADTLTTLFVSTAPVLIVTFTVGP